VNAAQLGNNMVSTRQIEANRANALKSTGPRTVEGKANSSRNAVTHGLSAQEIVIPGENIAAYQAFAQGLIDDLQPNGSCELDLIERLASTYWRLRRIPRFEATLMAWLEHRVFYDDADWTRGRESAASEKLADEQTAARWLGRNADEVKVCGRVLKEALTEKGILLKLNTYETRLLRQSQQLLGQFLALRKARTSVCCEGTNAAAADEDDSVGLIS
jgi:hypothetical protein